MQKPGTHQQTIFSFAPFFLFLLLTVFSHPAKSQEFVWGNSQEIDFDFNPEYLNYSLAVNSQGDIFQAGLKTFSSNYIIEAYGDNFFLKYDPSGNLLFSKLFEGECIITNMTCDNANNVLLVGMLIGDVTFAQGHTMTYTGSSSNTFLLKFDEAGEMIWMKNLTEIYTLSNNIRAIDSDGENNIYIAYDDNQNASTTIKRFSAEGIETLSIVQASVSLISSVDVNDEGDILVAGSCPSSNATFGGVPYNSGFSYASYVAKYNQSGQTQWVKFVEDLTCIVPRIKWSTTGDIYFSGRLTGAYSFGSLPTNGPAWVYDFFLAKLNSEGDFLWVREVPQSTIGDATVGKLNHLGLDNFGNPYIVGFTRGEIDWDDDLQTSITGNRGLIILSYNSAGDIQWIKTGNGPQDTQAIAVFSTDEIYMTGTAFGMVKLDDIIISSPSFYFPYLAKIEVDPTGIFQTASNTQIGIYPNPMIDHARIVIGNSSALITDVEVINMSGKTEKAFHRLNNSSFKIEKDDLSEGIYFVRIGLSNGTSITKKLVVLG